MNHKLLIIGLISLLGQNLALATCYESSILKPAPFLGNNGEIAKLSDGTIWEVMYEYNYLYEYYPSVIVCPDDGVIVVNGQKIQVKQLK